MANPKSKVLPGIIEVYLFVLVAFCFDAFYRNFMGDASILGNNLYGYVLGLVSVGVACVAKKKNVKSYGVILNPKAIFKGVYRGALFSLIPTAVVAGFSALIYAAFDFEWAKVQFVTPNHNYAGDVSTPITIAAYLISTIICVFAKEFFFRGYVIKTARSVYMFFDANAIQIALYVPMMLILHAKNIAMHQYSGDMMNPALMISIGVFWFVHEFITALKWGLLARVTRNIWASYFDHFFYNFITYSLLFSQSKITNYPTMVKLLIVQIISLIMVWYFYKKKRIERKQKKLQHEYEKIEKRHENSEKHALKSEEINERHAKKNQEILEDYNEGGVQKRIDDFSNSNLLRHRHISSKSHDYKDEKLMDLKDIEVDKFYYEYAKEIERNHQNKKETAAEKLQQSISKDKKHNK